MYVENSINLTIFESILFTNISLLEFDS